VKSFGTYPLPRLNGYSLLFVVSDSKIADFAEALGKHFVKASIKDFSFKEVESARR
jgi:hypothetical protein